MRLAHFFRILLATTTLVFSTSAKAATDKDIEALFSLSLEELMEVEIYTASQESETAAESPATISVITAEQLNQWGIINLHDAISFLPGIVKNETYIGQTTQTFRGINPGLFNNKSLYLINGHPSYESLFGSTLLDYIPLEMVERIEVVRSPASVLYGTNAMSGVINIITKQGTENSNDATVRAGSHSHKYGSIVYHTNNLSMAASVKRDDGYDYSGTLDEAGNPVDMDYRYDVDNIFIDGYGEDWRINAAIFDREKAFLGINPWVWHQGIFETYVGYIDANKKYRFDTSELNIWLRYDVSDKDIHTSNFPLPGTAAECSFYNVSNVSPVCPAPGSPADTASTVYNKVERYSLEVQYKDQVNENLSYIVGSSFESQDSDPLVFLYDADNSLNRTAIDSSQDTQTTAIYGQVKYRANEDTILVAGVRGEDNSEAGTSDLMPRLGVTYQVKPQTYIKLLYSEAFRTPMFIEKYVQLPGVLLGDENLDRETIKTYELGLDANLDENNQIQISLFSICLEDEILRFPLGPPDPTAEYRNGVGKEMQGIEAEWKSIVSEKLELILNASYVDGDDDSLMEDDAPYIANFASNVMITYHLASHWNASLTAQYIGEQDYVLASTSTRGTIDDYTLINLSSTYRIDQHALRLILHNITDEKYTYPEPVRRNIADVPGGPEFSAYVEYSYSFK